MPRSSGVLMHLTSLPGPFGIGVMGEEARRFADRLAESGVTYWQVLPLLQPSEDSPYQSFSAFAGCTWIIDPRKLTELGLLESDEIGEFSYQGEPWLTDYGFARWNSERMLKRAFDRLTAAQIEEVRQFTRDQDWLLDYALFMCIREVFGGLMWLDWPDEKLRRHDYDALADFRGQHESDIFYICFCQWLFWIQWHDLKSYINSLGLEVFGDIPIYVSTDSVEVWARPEYFQLDRDLRPTFVAGVPPDYFAEDGQLWGNALYDWDRMARDGYRWWISRIAASLDLYDMLRIDHFRGFEAYWAIPADAVTARDGSWQPGPGMKLFGRVRETLGPVNIVAEDLGLITEGVRQLLDDSGFPGMMVMQFAFQPGGDGTTLPHHYRRSLCAYTGTHDNDTLLGWLFNASEEERALAFDYIGFPPDYDWTLGGPQSPVCRAFIRYLWATVADFACVPVQDLCGFGSDTRMNIPGVETSMWRFRLPVQAMESLGMEWLRHLNELYERFNPVLKAREQQEPDKAEEDDRHAGLPDNPDEHMLDEALSIPV